MNKRIVFGSLLAVGLLAVSAGTASAQFVTPFGQPGPFGGSYGAVYQTPSGGVVQKQVYSNPFSGSTYFSKSYSNPFTGQASFVQSYSNPFAGVAFNRQAFVGPTFGTNFGVGFGNAFNTTPYVVTPVFGPYWRSHVATPLPFFRR